MIFIGKGCKSQPKDSFYFVCPERSLDFRQHGIIEIGSENIKRLSVDAFASDPDMLKVASWGSSRDMALIQRIRSYPLLESTACHSLHQGFIVANGSNKVPKELQHKKFIPSGQMTKYQITTKALNFFREDKTHRPIDISTYKAPLVIMSAKLDSTGAFSAFSHEDVIFTEKYSGISFLPDQENIAHYINGIINSAVASYFLFLTSSSWGVERDELKTQDLSRLPVPSPNIDNEHIVAKIVAIEQELRTSSSTDHQRLKDQLNEAVFELYGLDHTEKVLVEDGVNLTINLRMERENSIAIKKPSIDELKLYALQLIGVIQPFLQTLRERVLVANILEVRNSPLQVVKFSLVPASSQEKIVQITQVQELKAVLNRIAEQLPQQIADRIYTRRDLRIYTGQDIYIIKPAQKRFWSRSAGLNDADLILSEHLGGNHAAIG
jgi:uncharacterized protein YjhX (UPF0386 family)